jgi:hypothetical protein
MTRATGGRASITFIYTGATSNKIARPDYSTRFQNLNKYFQEQVHNVTENLAKSAVPIAQNAIRNAKTEWGKSRMAGNHYGVRFAPYGRSEGREETGFMHDSLSWSVEKSKSGKNMWEGRFGWTQDVLNQAPYIQFQAQGFYSTGAFDPVATAASGRARFKSGPEKFIEGALPLTPARKSIEKRIASAYSAAWNEAVRQWNSDGFKGNPGSYINARNSRIGSRRGN